MWISWLGFLISWDDLVFVTANFALLGRKTVYILGLAIFGLFSLGQSLVRNPPGFFVTRALSGVGAAMIFATTSGKPVNSDRA